MDGKGKFDVRKSLLNLPFDVEVKNSIYICRPCVDKLKKLENLKRQKDELLECLKKTYKFDETCVEGRITADLTEQADVAKRPRIEPSFTAPLSPVLGTFDSLLTAVLSSSSNIVHSTPKKVQLETSGASSNPTSLSLETRNERPSSSLVTVKLQWPSQTRERHLPEDLQSLGKMLVRGTYKQIANAAWNNPIIRKHLQILAVKQVDNECHNLCSRKEPSCLRSPTKSQLLDFSFEKLERELERRAPFTHAVLRTSCVNKRNSKERSQWVPTIGMAASIILRNKSSRLNAVQVLLSIFLYHSSWTVGIRFLKSVYILLIGFLHLMCIYIPIKLN